jgi:hydrogenase-4 component F
MILTLYFIVIALVCVGLFFDKKEKNTLPLVIGFLLIQSVLTTIVVTSPASIGFQYFYVDKIAALFTVILFILVCASVYYSFIYLKSRCDSFKIQRIYFISLVIFTASLTGAYLSNHFGLMWIFIELTTLSAGLLVYHHRSEKALEAAWKYIFVCTLSITLVFIGILFLAQASKSIPEADLSVGWLVTHANLLTPFWLKAAFLFIFVGFTAKAGLVPMFTAGVDAKDKAPTPVAALFSSVLLNAGFLGIFRIYQIVSQTPVLSWSKSIMFISGVLSIFVAAVYMLKIKNMKRMLAYSSIEHMGIVIIGFAIGGIGYYAALLHLVIHSFAKSTVFFQLGQVSRIYHTMNTNEAGRYYEFNKAGAIVLLLGFFCITALPPTGLFISEFLVFQSLIDANHFVVISIVIILMAFIVYAVGQNMFNLLFGQNNVEMPNGIERIPYHESIIQLVILFVVIGLGVYIPLPLSDYLMSIVSVFPK